ncbi:MAG: enoyl-CoA hydratase-related protein [Pseudomonadota bacterium]
MEDQILLVQKKQNVCTLVLNRPQKRNALSPELLVRLSRTLVELSRDDTIRTLVIRGAGDKAFSSGYDITALPTNISPEIKKNLKDRIPFESAIQHIVNYPYPVIAMLNGSAFGGACDLAVSCDIRIAVDDIRMGMVAAKIGLVYSPVGLRRFIQTIGLSSTKEIFFSARTYDAAKLKELGLVDYLVPRPELESFTYELAEDIAGNAPLSLRGIKRILNMVVGSETMRKEDRQEADQLIEEAIRSEDLKEGQAAFIQKRRPLFKGK